MDVRFVFSILLTLGAGLFIPFFLIMFPKIMGNADTNIKAYVVPTGIQHDYYILPYVGEFEEKHIFSFLIAASATGPKARNCYYPKLVAFFILGCAYIR